MTRIRRIGWTELRASATKGRILIVEDDAEIRGGLQRMVTRLGYVAHAAASAEEADRWTSNERYDAVLLDIELPRMSGVEYLTWALKRQPELSVIMLTGLDIPKVAIECLDAGARTYLVKPPDAEFLRLALRDAVAMHRLLVERNDLAEKAENGS